jgi:hypothetical protein
VVRIRCEHRHVRFEHWSEIMESMSIGAHLKGSVG